MSHSPEWSGKPVTTQIWYPVWGLCEWTGPQTYQSNAELLGDIARHPQLKQHHHLAHVGWLAANNRSLTKNDFFP